MPEEFAQAVRGVDGGSELVVQRGIRLRQRSDELFSGSASGCGNLWLACGKELLFLHFDVFPGRVAQYDVESSFARSGYGGRVRLRSEYFGKFQRPMKERLAERECPGAAVESGVNRPAAEVIGERGGGDYWS